MNYMRGNPTQEEMRMGLINAAIGLLVIVPMLISLFFPHRPTLRAGYVLTAVAMTLVVPLYLLIRFREMKSAVLVLPAKLTLSMTIALAISIGFLDYAYGGKVVVFKPVFVLDAIFIGLIGDIAMQVTMWAATTTALLVSSAAMGLPAHELVATIVLTSSCMAVGQTMSYYAVENRTRLYYSRSILRDMTDLTLAAESIEEGLGLALPLVGGVLPSTRSVALLKRPGERTFSVVSQWPPGNDQSGNGVLDERTVGAATESLRAPRATVENEHIFLPIGKTPFGELVVVVFRYEKGNRTAQFMQEVSDATMATILKMVTRIGITAALREESRTDPLTGLPNRRALEERIAVEFGHARRNKSALCLALMDLDHFKEYNDTFGHLKGDELIRQQAADMSARLPEGSFLARFGGEEFCAFFPVALDKALIRVEALRNSIQLEKIMKAVTVSAGLAEWDGVESFESLLQRADTALYEAKRSGRNCTRSYEPVKLLRA